MGGGGGGGGEEWWGGVCVCGGGGGAGDMGKLLGTEKISRIREERERFSIQSVSEKVSLCHLALHAHKHQSPVYLLQLLNGLQEITTCSCHSGPKTFHVVPEQFLS